MPLRIETILGEGKSHRSIDIRPLTRSLHFSITSALPTDSPWDGTVSGNSNSYRTPV